MRYLIYVCSLTVLILLAQDLTAQGKPVSPPREVAFLELLEKRCQECHHPDTDDEPPYLHAAINLEEILDGDMVVKGDPEASALFRRITLAPEARKRMPRSRGEATDETYRSPLTTAEKKVMEDWIRSLGSASSDTLPVADAEPANSEVTEIPAEVIERMPSAGEAGSLPMNLSLEGQVHWILDRHCAKCHGTKPGSKQPELTGTTNLALLLRDEEFVSAGSPEKSLFLDLVRLPEEDGDRMPKSKGKPGSSGYRRPLNAAELKVLEKWIANASEGSEQREFIPGAMVVKQIADDVRIAPESKQPFLRYFTLTNLYNTMEADGKPTVDDATLNSHRAGLSKLVNSLSSSANITRPEAIDKTKTIYRIDLRDYGWVDESWNYLVRYYPYGMVGVDKQKERLIEKATGSPMAYVRADWFVFAASQPPLYEEIMGRVMDMDLSSPGNVVERIEHRLKVPRMANLQRGNAIRAGFQYSGVSEANRLVERHALGSHQGSYWISYDFTPLSPVPQQDLKRAPLGPPEARLTENPHHAFLHDGGEIIYNLPNGLQGYALATAKGDRLNRAPIEIVQDDQRPDNQIINGISCMACHDQGMKAPPSQKKSLSEIRDEIRPLVESAGILDFKGNNLLKQLYKNPRELRRVIKEDAARFQTAQAEAVGDLAGPAEPILGLYSEFRGWVTARELAAEFGLTYDELLELLREEALRSEALSVLVHSLEQQIPLRRENIMRDYVGIVQALGYSLMPFEPLAYEDFGGEDYAALVLASDDYRLAFGEQFIRDLAANKADFDVPELPAAPERATLARKQAVLTGGGKIEISIQPNLRVGERAELQIDATEDVYVRAVHLSSDQFVIELFPGATGQSGFLKASDMKEISWETTRPGGAEHVIVYVSRKPIKNTGARGAQVLGSFKMMKKEKFFNSRGVPTAIQASTKSSHVPAPVAIDEIRIGYILKE